MVNTRRRSAATPDQLKPAKPRAQRTPSRRKALAILDEPASIKVAKAKRRTRSSKNDQTPLQSLKPSTRSSRGRRFRSSQSGTPESTYSDGESDIGAGIFFKFNPAIHSSPKKLEVSQKAARIDDSAEIVQEGSLQGTQEALDLLHMIENSAKTSAPEHVARNDVAQTELQTTTIDAPVTPTKPQLHHTPSTGFFGKIFSTFSSIRASFTPTRAVSTPRPTPGPKTSPSDLTLLLTPAPTPMGEDRPRAKKPYVKGTRRKIIDSVKDSVQDPNEQAKAEAWAESVLAKFPQSSALLGSKRKRFEGGVKVGDLRSIHGTKPWKTGSFGLDDDIGDLSDDEEAPAWAILQDLAEELERVQNPRPTKRAKTTQTVIADAQVRSPKTANQFTAPTPTRLNLFNSNGTSVDPLDLQPRSSTAPSALFTTPKKHQPGNNLFKELETQNPTRVSTAEKQATTKRDLRRLGHIEGTGSFCVPDGDSDSEEEDVASDASAVADDSPAWTKDPPPAPVPAHASLPKPVGENPSTPATPALTTAPADPAKSVDPIELQRAKATKHTPAKPSRLREMYVPSPSAKSDAGIESIFGSSILPLVAPASDSAWDPPEGLPEADSIPLSPDDMANVEAFVKTEQFKMNVQALPWDNPVISFSDDESE